MTLTEITEAIETDLTSAEVEFVEAELVPHFSKVCFNHPSATILRESRSPISTRMTIAYQSFFLGDEKHVVFGFAVCSPKDTFKKATGRELALERLNDDEMAVSFQLKPGETRPIHQIISDYITVLSGITHIPGMAANWSELWVG